MSHLWHAFSLTQDKTTFCKIYTHIITYIQTLKNKTVLFFNKFPHSHCLPSILTTSTFSFVCLCIYLSVCPFLIYFYIFRSFSTLNFQPIDLESFESRLALTGLLLMVIVVGIWAMIAFYCFVKHEKKRLKLDKLANKSTQL